MKNHRNAILAIVSTASLAGVASLAHADDAHDDDRSTYSAPMAAIPPTIDGIAKELVWQKAEWRKYVPQNLQGKANLRNAGY